MKHTAKILLGSLSIIAMQFAGSGCVGPGGGDGGGVAYGTDVWVHDGTWVDGGGRGWFGGHGGGAYVHPSGGGRGDSHPSGGATHDSGGGGHDAGGGSHGGGGDEHKK